MGMYVTGCSLTVSTLFQHYDICFWLLFRNIQHLFQLTWNVFVQKDIYTCSVVLLFKHLRTSLFSDLSQHIKCTTHKKNWIFQPWEAFKHHKHSQILHEYKILLTLLSGSAGKVVLLPFPLKLLVLTKQYVQYNANVKQCKTDSQISIYRQSDRKSVV